MRTTISLDEDVAAAVKELRRTEGIGVSEAVNRLVRAGLTRPSRRRPYRQRSADIGIRVDITDIGVVLELLDET
jgi:Arc/MetJ family transcription regulator